METIAWNDFERVELRVGRIIGVKDFPEARKPAYILEIDFGEELGLKKASARITQLYRPAELMGKQVVAVVNFAPKQIGPMRSECLVTGFPDQNGAVVLCVPERSVPLGSKLF